jgi:predicted alpha/beta hydrolase family esterase
MKRVFIVHGWSGSPDEGWFPWLKTELEKKGFEVTVPAMPDPDEPKIETWVSHLAKVVGEPNDQTFFIGHSIGCQTILRYLEKLPASQSIGGAIFVAGWFVLSDLETEEEKIIGRPWVETPIDFEKIKTHTSKFFTLFSDDDEVVPLKNKQVFENNLGSETAITTGMGHFSGGDGVTSLPTVLEKLLQFSN